MPDDPLTSLGKPGEPCEECGAPLATDQRYCLECGHRRGGPRVEYRALAGAPAAAEPATPAEPPHAAVDSAKEPVVAEAGRRERDYAPLAAVAGIALLGLMLLIGVLIGKDNSTASAPATPQVVRVAPSGGEMASEGGGSGAASGGGKGLASGSAKKKGGGGGGNGGGGDKEVVQASDDQLEALESETGEAAAKNALKLPNKIATPGAPPPIDKSKPPGGGEGEGMTIK